MNPKLEFLRNLFSISRSLPTTRSERSERLRVLLIEADDNDRKACKSLLENSFHVIDFPDSFDAGNYSRANIFDVAIINDSIDANINGSRILYELRQASRKSFRAFALVSRPSEEQRKYLITAGFEEMISKPINANAVSDLIYFRKILG